MVRSLADRTFQLRPGRLEPLDPKGRSPARPAPPGRKTDGVRFEVRENERSLTADAEGVPGKKRTVEAKKRRGGEMINELAVQAINDKVAEQAATDAVAEVKAVRVSQIVEKQRAASTKRGEPRVEDEDAQRNSNVSDGGPIKPLARRAGIASVSDGHELCLF